MVKTYTSPGPKYAASNTVGHENTDPRLPRAPAYSLGRLLPEKQTHRIPGPKYDLNNVTRCGPIKVTGVSLASRPKEMRAAHIPGPAAYNTVPCLSAVKHAMPMYSLGVKQKDRKKYERTPGPNAYLVKTTIGNCAPDIPSAPMYSIPGRYHEQKHVKSYTSPGPAKYPAVQIERYKQQTPRAVMLGRNEQAVGGHRKRTPAPNAYFPGMASRYTSAPQFTIAGRIPQRADPYYTAADKVPDWE